ncbi:MAG: four helix bundle protein [Bacteroidales bacterium]|nr:four helix bundle protein [Bacteroidales bacterium]
MHHRDLNVWKESIKLVKKAYTLSADFPTSEQFGLTSQLRRAVVSIPSNIAEGCGRNSDKELIRFCWIAMGSLSEVDTQLVIAKELGYVNDTKEIDASISNVRKLLSGFINYLENKQNC